MDSRHYKKRGKLFASILFWEEFIPVVRIEQGQTGGTGAFDVGTHYCPNMLYKQGRFRIRIFSARSQLKIPLYKSDLYEEKAHGPYPLGTLCDK